MVAMKAVKSTTVVVVAKGKAMKRSRTAMSATKSLRSGKPALATKASRGKLAMKGMRVTKLKTASKLGMKSTKQMKCKTVSKLVRKGTALAKSTTVGKLPTMLRKPRTRPGKNNVNSDAQEEARAKKTVAAVARFEAKEKAKEEVRLAKEKAKEEARLAKEKAKAERDEARRARAVAEEECRIETEQFRQRLAEEEEQEANTHEMQAVDAERVKAAGDADEDGGNEDDEPADSANDIEGDGEKAKAGKNSGSRTPQGDVGEEDVAPLAEETPGKDCEDEDDANMDSKPAGLVDGVATEQHAEEDAVDREELGNNVAEEIAEDEDKATDNVDECAEDVGEDASEAGSEEGGSEEGSTKRRKVEQ